LSQSVGAVTGPRVVSWIGNHSGAYRVELNVALAYEQVGLRLHERGFVPTVPECAGSTVSVIDVLDVAPADRDNQPRDRGRVFWGEQEMDMVGHQHVGVKLAVLVLQGVAQPAEVGVAILIVEKAGSAIVATLHDVQRYTVDVDAGTPGHGGSLAEIEPGPFFRLREAVRCSSVKDTSASFTGMSITASADSKPS